MLVLLLRFTLLRFLPAVILGGHSSVPLHSDPINLLAPLDSSSPPGSVSVSDSKSDSDSESYFNSDSDSNSDFKTVAASAALFFALSKSILACSHHHQDTFTPGC